MIDPQRLAAMDSLVDRYGSSVFQYFQTIEEWEIAIYHEKERLEAEDSEHSA